MASSRILDFVVQTVWAIEPSVMDRLVEIVTRHAEGVKLSQEELDLIAASRRQSKRDGRPQVIDGVARIPVTGVIAKYASQVDGISGPSGTATETISAQLQAALADDQVRAILLDIDSPGGAVAGVPELADEIAEAREQKPIYALADGMAASAAFWLGAQADRFFATRGSYVGSIGVITPVMDASVAAHNAGVKVHYVTSAPAKAAGGKPGAPVTDSDLREVRDRVDAVHELFVDAVASGRRISRERAAELADGRIHVGAKAREAGLVDGVMSFKQVMAAIQADATERRASGGRGGAARDAAEDEGVDLMATDKGATAPDAGLQAAAKPTNEQPRTKDDLVRMFPDQAGDLLRDGAQTERERQKAIRSRAFAGQEDLVEKLIADGASVQEATEALLLDLKATGKVEREQRLEQLRRAGRPVGQVDDDAEDTADLVGDGPGTKPAASLSPEEQAKHEFTTVPAVGATVDSPEKWVLFKKRFPEKAAAILKGGA